MQEINDDSHYPYQDIHHLKFRDSELNSNNTRYDNIVAGGSDEVRFLQWTVYASISLSVAAFVFVVLISILRKEQVRSRTFNLYLVFLIIPDLVFSLFCGINCAINASVGDYVSAGWCRFQVVYCVWGIGSNAWLNGCIARHVHQMLLCGHQLKRYYPPKRKQVILESLAVYAWLAFVSAWPFIEFLPHRLALSAGLACLPHEYDTSSTIFFWLVFMPCFALIPTGYALYVAFDVWRRHLLPPRGKRRNIAVYFFRLTAVFLIMWLPSIFLMFIAGAFLSSWVAFLGGCWSHLQGAVSGIVSIMKQDIGEAFLELVTCGKQASAPAATSRTWMVSFRSFQLSAPSANSESRAFDCSKLGETPSSSFPHEGKIPDSQGGNWALKDEVSHPFCEGDGQKDAGEVDVAEGNEGAKLGNNTPIQLNTEDNASALEP